MHAVDWLLVIAINVAIVGYGLLGSRSTKTSLDWFLAARGLPWWIVGLSMFATAVDSGDFVAVVGGASQYGISNLTTWWLGMPIGWFLVAFFLLPPIYASGMFTNAEYLEFRFGPTARLLSVLIQFQYRTNVLANIAYSLFLLFSTLTGWGMNTWWLVVAVAGMAGAYTSLGGLKSVAVTDALQSIVMVIGAAVLWYVVWHVVGGWSGIEERLAANDPSLVEELMHVGGRTSEDVAAPLMIFGWVASLSAYCVVNQSQAMRMLACRSPRDIRGAAVLASVVTAVVMALVITLGVMGRALVPGVGDSVAHDEVFPRLVEEHLGVGLKGLVVAGVLAGGVSTFDSISSALASVFTRDFYARFCVKYGRDEHYVLVSRLVTVVAIAASFAYVPYLKAGMLEFYLRLTNVAVIPLFTVYLLGALTRVHRRSGVWGLGTGIAYGLTSFLGDHFAWPLPFWWTNMWWAYPVSMLVTSGAMLVATLVFGWESRESLRGLVWSPPSQTLADSPTARPLPGMQGTWLEQTRSQTAHLPSMGTDAASQSWLKNPLVWALLLLGALGFVNLVVLW